MKVREIHRSHPRLLWRMHRQVIPPSISSRRPTLSLTSDRTKSTCTSYQGILSGTVDGVITLKNASGISCMIITGGTEVGYAGVNSHANGFKVDVRHQAKLDDYITTTFTRIANRGDGFPQWQKASGNGMRGLIGISRTFNVQQDRISNQNPIAVPHV
ncbi:hypothetical protein FPV67DRAFT_1485017 [Lyophyllum atratum]|nr:hypothetical protein FPV67DRAFT_1485017 [Lyophyllum atratum]